MVPRKRVEIELAKLGIVGDAVEQTVQKWWDTLEPFIKSAYPQDMWEAADLYLLTHDIRSLTGQYLEPMPDHINASNAKDQVSIILAQNGYVGPDVEDLIQKWYKNIPRTLLEGYPNDMWEAALKHLNTHPFCDLEFIADGYLGEGRIVSNDKDKLTWLRDYFSIVDYSLVEKQVIIDYVLRYKLKSVNPDDAINALYEFLKDRDKILDDNFEYRRMYYGLKDFSEPKRYNKIIQNITE